MTRKLGRDKAGFRREKGLDRDCNRRCVDLVGLHRARNNVRTSILERICGSLYL